MKIRWIVIITILILIALGILYNYMDVENKSSNIYSVKKGLNQQQIAKINKSQTNFTFAVYGDSRNSSGIFKKIITNINSHNASFSINLGDMVWQGSDKEFKMALNDLNLIKSPVMSVLGNHELDYANSSQLFQSIFGETYYSFAMKNSYFIIIDDVYSSRMDNNQFKWLENELKKSLNYQNRFIFVHVPLYDPRMGNYGQNHSLENRTLSKKLNQLFDKYNVTMVFAGHIHGYFNGKWNKTPYIITGGAGSPLHGSNPENFYYQYILVNVTDDNVTYTPIKINFVD